MKLKRPQKNTKTGKNFRGGGGEFFRLARIYTPGVPFYGSPVANFVMRQIASSFNSTDA